MEPVGLNDLPAQAILGEVLVQEGGCLSCGRGFHKECKRCRSKKCHKFDTFVTEGAEKEEEYESASATGDSVLQPKRRKKDDLKDPKSTGRKRAARLYPLDSNSPCEWRGLRNCGGGLRPIIGCLNGNQEHRHHGPIKDTTRNELGNVHRICNDCHNHWHELNDLVYIQKDYELLPHNPVEATPKDIIEYTLKWKTGEMGKLFELASSKNKEKYDAKQLEEMDT